MMDYVHFDAEDMKKNNLMAALGCVLFPIPLIACPDSKLGRFCANQGLVFCLIMIALKLVFGIAGALLGWIPLLGPLVKLVGALAQAAAVLYAFYLAWKAYNRGSGRKRAGHWLRAGKQHAGAEGNVSGGGSGGTAATR